jgi:hypothetical protein
VRRRSPTVHSLHALPRPSCRIMASPKLYAQIGYKTMWHLNTPWWLCTPLQYAAIYDTVGEVGTAELSS